MPQPNDLSRSLSPFVQGNTLVAVIELSLTSWLVAGVIPGVERQPLKKLAPDEKGRGSESANFGLHRSHGDRRPVRAGF